MLLETLRQNIEVVVAAQAGVIAALTGLGACMIPLEFLFSL